MQVMLLSKMEIWKEKPDIKTENTDQDHVIDRDHQTITGNDRQDDQAHDHRIDLPIEMVGNMPTEIIRRIETENIQDSDFKRKCFNRVYHIIWSTRDSYVTYDMSNKTFQFDHAFETSSD